jgi:inorganic phosphate transporter, PiT family
MDSGSILIAIVVAVALIFDFTNGFHDTANAMATTVATGVLPPRVAVILANALSFVGAFLSLKVAAAIALGIILDNLATSTIVFAVLFGAIGWNLITWYFGLPSSPSHALIGGVIGVTAVAVGFGGINGSGCYRRCSSRPSSSRWWPAQWPSLPLTWLTVPCAAYLTSRFA